KSDRKTFRNYQEFRLIYDLYPLFVTTLSASCYRIGPEAVAPPPHGVQVLRLLWVALDLFAQIADVDRKAGGGILIALPPYVFQQLYMFHHPILAFDQVAQQAVLGRGQVDRLAVAQHDLPLQVDGQVLVLKASLGRVLAAVAGLQAGLDARLKFAHPE